MSVTDVTTLGEGEAGLSIRFEPLLADQQSLGLSVVAKPAEPSHAVEMARAADKLAVSSAHKVSDEGHVCIPAGFR
jgi:hypothetical protein